MLPCPISDRLHDEEGGADRVLLEARGQLPDGVSRGEMHEDWLLLTHSNGQASLWRMVVRPCGSPLHIMLSTGAISGVARMHVCW